MKTWLVTGASGGLGAAITKAALHRGDRVVVSARNIEGARALAREVPDRALAVRIDVEDSQSISRGIEEALAWAGRIDVLVNNAGRGFHGAVEEVSDAEARALFETNVFGLLSVTRPVLAHMRENRTGHVINIGSMAGLASGAGTGIYCATKFALEGISEAMHAELSPLGIKVTIVEPGPFRTEFNGSSIRQAARSIPDYESTAGERIAALRASNGHQPGDPAKAAELICDIAAMDSPPLHLVVGGAAIERAQRKLEQLGAEIAAWEERSRATSFSS
ncbi:oxidoreductase [Chelativorans sp. Marseille-P2723]|uniref:oxidoreductase n=1 Tax=Chelativorans sp. Marseille-P2723 TaxID=2709133 RepID=UPI00156E93BA|nr:oxidoreductase [Chelativorans sp. Marseille-P2723]